VHEKDFRMLDETYNEQAMAVTIARGYLRPLMENGKVVLLPRNFPRAPHGVPEDRRSNALEP
jgi:hypothetical protein